MRIRMVTPEKLGKVFDVPDARAQDLIERGMAEAYQEPVMQTTTVTPVVRKA